MFTTAPIRWPHIAEVFNVSIDYLLAPDAARRPFRAPADPLAERLTQLDVLSAADRVALTHILEDLFASARIRAANSAT